MLALLADNGPIIDPNAKNADIFLIFTAILLIVCFILVASTAPVRERIVTLLLILSGILGTIALMFFN